MHRAGAAASTIQREIVASAVRCAAPDRGFTARLAAPCAARTKERF